MEYGLQIYSVRDELDKDLKGTLKKLAEMGYTEIELDGRRDMDGKVYRSWLDEFGLRVVSGHFSLDDLDADFSGLVQFMKEVGCGICTIPWAWWRSIDFFDKNIDVINRYSKLLADEGIALQFHSHTDEWQELEGRTAIREMFERTDVLLQIDTYWCYVAGKNPIEEMERYHDRIRTIHLKDGDAEGNGCVLGLGSAPVAEVAKTAERLGIRIIVESENQQPDGITEVRNCLEYLKTVL